MLSKAQILGTQWAREYWNMTFGSCEDLFTTWTHPHDHLSEHLARQLEAQKVFIPYAQLGTIRACLGGRYRECKERLGKPGHCDAYNNEQMELLSQIYWATLDGEFGTDYGMPVNTHHSLEWPL